MEEFLKYHQNLPNEDLVRIAYFELLQVKKQARKSARQVLKERKIEQQEIEQIKHQIRQMKREERRIKLKNKNEKYGLLDFVIDVILYG